MVELSNFMGRDGFHWFIGVVEDRDDPARLGRARVRCLGYHTDDITELPTTDLPWAHVMHPVTDPCMHGMGNTPSFLVEGSYVVGFFRDPEKQQLVIMGTLPGVPQEEADPSVGFNNPRSINAKQDYYKGDPKYGPYPVDGIIYTMASGHQIGESDTNRLARGKVSETHNSLINRRKNRLSGDPTSDGTGIPTATKPDLSAVTGASSAETRGFFEEPHPKSIESTSANYIASAYPFNHVFESESGHIREIDDSPNAERLFTQHKSGTFEEIHPDGSKVVKVIGDNYEIIAGSSNVNIKGNVNITTEGTVREYIKGDYILEVEGTYTQKIGGSLRTKIGYKSGGNLEEEIIGNHAYGIKGYVKGNVGPLGGGAADGEGNVDINIVGRETHIVGKEITLHGEKDVFLSSNDSMAFITSNGLAIESATDVVSVKAGTAVDIRSTTTTTIESGTLMDIDALAGGITIDATGTIAIDALMNMTLDALTGIDIDGTTSVDIDAVRIDLN